MENKDHKGQKMKNGKVWWSIDKPMAERLVAKKTGRGMRLLKDWIKGTALAGTSAEEVEEELKKWEDAKK